MMAGSLESEKYEVLETIGRGSFGTIRKVKRTSDGHILCRKEIQYIKMSQKEREQLHAEFSILNSLKHENIVGYYHREHLKATQELYLYMEYCGGGDLGQEIQKLKAKNQYADEEYVWSIFAQLVSALYRCHYGVDVPEPGKNMFGVVAKPGGLRTKNQVTILHRDLKPENVFLGIDNSVKLGDFGLSKLMQSHDFASTYVGTPFYMSPEICGEERYTLHSDIWSLGCVIYELCARSPPFKAKTHLGLIQKIKEGRLDSLPSVYSQELQAVIKSCLNTNPHKRPDTASLLNVPAIRLVRKQKEVVDLGRILKLKEEHMNKKAREAEIAISKVQHEREQMKADLESSLRREWEVKAGLEISRQVNEEKDRLQKIFEAEIQLRVQTEIEKRLRTQNSTSFEQTIEDSHGVSSVSTSADTDFPSTTDLSNLSLDSNSPAVSKTPPQRRARGPLARARTQFDSPMDVHMADPSPMSIACLSLSPRRTELASNPSNLNSKNIFAVAAAKNQKLLPGQSSPRTSMILEDDEDAVPDLPSPTRPHSALPDPFKVPGSSRPGLLRQKTLPSKRLNSQTQPTIFQPTAAERPSRVPSPPSPKHSGFSPVRKAPPKPPVATGGSGENEMLKAIVQRNMLSQNTTGGRTLVELAQARAGMPSQAQKLEKMDIMSAAEKKENLHYSQQQQQQLQQLQRRGSGESQVLPAPLWDPERDEMPSPFLVRGNKGIRRLLHES